MPVSRVWAIPIAGAEESWSRPPTRAYPGSRQIRLHHFLEGVEPSRMLVQARDAVDAFHILIRRNKEEALEEWLEQAAQTLLAPFALRPGARPAA